MFNEGDDVPTTDTPQFVSIKYAIEDRGDILPILSIGLPTMADLFKRVGEHLDNKSYCTSVNTIKNHKICLSQICRNTI